MWLSLANKYRSRDFTDLIGQDHISHILHYQAAHGIRQTNYLFTGPRGTGKTSTARIFAKALNCLNLNDGNPCHQCANCQMIDRNETMDIIEIDAASHTGVDNIREEIIDKAGYRPTVLNKKVYIIDEVHMLSKGAFNALLKTMEEPRDYMVFILATTELSKVPETIVSRCQVFNFKKIELWLIIERLRYIAGQESISTTDDGLHMIAQLSDGCMRDAVKYLDQISSMGEVTAEHVAQFLGVVSDTSMASMIGLLRARYEQWDQTSFDTLIDTLTTLTTNGIDLTLLPKQMMWYIDEHFADDQDFYASLTTMVSGLMRDARRYPHPLLLYKTSLWLWKSSEFRVQNSESVIRNPQSKNAKTTPSQNDVSTEQTPLKDILLDEVNDIPSVDNRPSTSSDVDTSWDTAPSSLSVWEDDLTAQFVALIPTGSLKTMLQGQCEIESITDGVVRLIILNSLAKMTLNKKETQESLLATIRTLTSDPLHALQIVSMTREEYVMR